MPDDPSKPPQRLTNEEREKLFDMPAPVAAKAPPPIASAAGSFLELDEKHAPAGVAGQSGKVVDRFYVGGFGRRAARLVVIGVAVAVFFAWGIKILYRY